MSYCRQRLEPVVAQLQAGDIGAATGQAPSDRELETNGREWPTFQ